MSDHPAADLVSPTIKGIRRTIVNELCAAYPRSVPIERLISTVYGKRAPSNPKRAMFVHVCTLRDKVLRFGWEIPPVRTGYPARYKLSRQSDNTGREG